MAFIFSESHGGSDRFRTPLSPRFMHHEALEVLPRVLDAFDIGRPVLFGHSDGASIALIYAGSTPHSPAALVLEAPHVFVEPVTASSIAAIRDAYRVTDLRARLERQLADGTHPFAILDPGVSIKPYPCGVVGHPAARPGPRRGSPGPRRRGGAPGRRAG